MCTGGYRRKGYSLNISRLRGGIADLRVSMRFGVKKPLPYSSATEFETPGTQCLFINEQQAPQRHAKSRSKWHL